MGTAKCSEKAMIMPPDQRVAFCRGHVVQRFGQGSDTR